MHSRTLTMLALAGALAGTVSAALASYTVTSNGFGQGSICLTVSDRTGATSHYNSGFSLGPTTITSPGGGASITYSWGPLWRQNITATAVGGGSWRGAGDSTTAFHSLGTSGSLSADGSTFDLMVADNSYDEDVSVEIAVLTVDLGSAIVAGEEMGTTDAFIASGALDPSDVKFTTGLVAGASAGGFSAGGIDLGGTFTEGEVFLFVFSDGATTPTPGALALLSMGALAAARRRR